MRRTLAVCAWMVLFFTALGVMLPQVQKLQAQPQAEKSAPVTVVNTPLPVSLSGIGSVSGTVNVASLPAVQLAAGSSVLVSDVDSPARHAFVLDLCATSSGPCNGGFPSTATVPVGMRYVIEQASGRCEVTSGSIDGVRLSAQVNGQPHLYAFKNEISAPTSETTIGYFYQQTRIYADGGIPNGLSVQMLDACSSCVSGFFCQVTLSGHLVNTSPIFPTQP